MPNWNQYIMVLFKADNTVAVYGPFDTADEATDWTKNFPGRRVAVDALIKPTWNAD